MNQPTIQHVVHHISLVEFYKADVIRIKIATITWNASLIHVVLISTEQIVAKLPDGSQVCSQPYPDRRFNSYQKKIKLKIIVFKLQSMGDGAIGSQLVLITASMNLTERSNRYVTVITRCQNMEETCVQNLISTKDSFHVMQQITKV